MRGKNKSLLEDILILFTGGILIYFTYSFFFSSNEKEEIIETPQTIEKKEETITPQPIINEIKKEEITLPKVENKVESKIENKVEEIQKEKPLQKVEENTTKASPITPIPTPVVVEKIVQKEPEKPAVIEQTKELDDKARIDAFYKTIKEKIYLNIDKRTPAATAEPITPDTLGPIACINKMFDLSYLSPVSKACIPNSFLR